MKVYHTYQALFRNLFLGFEECECWVFCEFNVLIDGLPLTEIHPLNQFGLK